MNSTALATADRQEKKTRRFLRQVAARAALELETLREIPDSPASLDYFYRILASVYVENNPGKILDAGGTQRPAIGLYCMVVPEELIYAAGAVPVRLCLGSFEAAQAGEDFLPRDACALAKSAMGASMQAELKIFDRCEQVIVPTMCDAKRKLGEELSASKEVWMMQMPHIKDADISRQIWLEQVWALKNRLETSGAVPAKKITARNLGCAIDAVALAQSEIRRLIAFRGLPSPLLWGRQAMAVLNAYAFAPVTDWTAALIRLNQDLAERAEEERTVCPSDRPRILIAGSPSVFPNMKMPALVEEMGGLVVYDESCAGDRYLYDPVGSTEKSLRDQITAIASRYMSPCVCPSFAPNEDRLVMIRRMAESHRVDGVLYHVLKGCIVYDFEVHRVETALKDQGIPLLRVETDYNPEDVEQLRTRIEAFIEMLKAGKKKKTRREE